MRTSFHSHHEPTCAICKKHCRSLDSLREHLIGPLPKQECRNIFATRGCKFCLAILDSSYSQRLHQERCQFSPGLLARFANLGIRDGSTIIDSGRTRGSGAIALACKYVGGGSDGSLDICAKVCLVDEGENVIFYSYVKPIIPVTNYRYEFTGVRPEHLRDAMPLKQVQKKIQEFLCNGEQMWKIRPGSTRKARILVGHGLQEYLTSLQIDYPSIMIRDTAKYPPLMKTSKLSNSLHYLTQTYLGQVFHITLNSLIILYNMENGKKSEGYEECVATMRLYLKMKSQVHKREEYPLASDPPNKFNFAIWKQLELEKMTPQQLLQISRSDYYCWCLDATLQ
ncbi:RNA exonuclease 4 [Cucumis melo var. makuwa]|uniref:RNA exonuclease 4 n=1 Tax=Cucumis melo var. makuwa TaxID=1194695 RepID=A0A5A7T8A0_CUCMM|nr:RNA exonuclease 4 [Cucumis melo var. makuwa]